MMNMKLTIFNLLQTGVQRMAVCALALGFTTVGYAQSGDDEEEEEEVETAIAQPTRSQMQRDNYPLVTLRGIVTEQATGTPLAGIQLQALGYPAIRP